MYQLKKEKKPESSWSGFWLSEPTKDHPGGEHGARLHGIGCHQTIAFFAAYGDLDLNQATMQYHSMQLPDKPRV